MTPTIEQCVQGGSVKAADSPKKAKALRRLHKSRRGQRVNNIGISEHELTGLLGEVIASIRNPQSGRSMRALAIYCDVDDKTVRRWLNGTDWPAGPRVRKLQQWVKEHSLQ